MAHYALLTDNNIVKHVFVGRDEDDLAEGVTSWEDYYASVNKARCVRTSYNTRGGVHYDLETGEPSADQSKAFRKNYAGMNFVFDENLDAFIPPKPYDSWVLSEESCLWESPIPYPSDGLTYEWDENAGDWVAVETPGA